MSRRRPNVMLTIPKNTLQVFDMGLDFRSYLSRVDVNGLPVLGNVVSYEASKLTEVFTPTVGLLVTILHMLAHCTSSCSAVAWLKAYDAIQKMYIENSEEENTEAVRYAVEARAAIKDYLTGDAVPGTNLLCEKLLTLLDQQSGIHGSQAPSQRKVPREPKGAFCNLHLSDQKCYQDFACNQLHLQEVKTVRHRKIFYMRLIEVLKAEKRSRQQIRHRIKDSVFFARYGNKVTVQCQGKWIPFFKTVYTDGRLEQALRTQHFACGDSACADENCLGIHPQDRRVTTSSKLMDLNNPDVVLQQIEEEAERHLSMEGAFNDHEAEHISAAASSSSMPSPTSEMWRNTVREYVRQTGIPQVEADESLLRTLQDANVLATPTASTESLTPLLDELDMRTFSSSSPVREHPNAEIG
ncbi:zinc finger CCCH domain containing protein 17 [Trypanosoma equiperdum]|uniref:Uncharacterized protein n=4 Tax=Trypanozoon TaxID=39700 RepID=Q57VT9_TRYB2|nr:hypothetical protein, conserved [Trypanosoma brucei brucei TREU927]AAX70280.1 hypothetical protein, conserved [Trypanosoma brucei]AAZ12158.1 hypothetical protein, conserved [Trypanosoma brucei brucei TREU927]RHW71423.1 zinc finger CCCH domain containing protein 17 [Trypanosoma brucei equiperdum]SCU69351.1 zinc finger CCCH domain containing protein 17 [Trypanosoma equiperdum]